MSAFEKKDPGKFTVRFNMADPQQKSGQEPGAAAALWEEPDGSPSETSNPAEDADKEAILQTLDAFQKQ